MGESCARQWYNWLAYMYQKLEAPGTAWVWHGAQGTGKGVIFHKILSMLFGADNVAMKRMEELEDKFNGHLEGCLLCFIDEAQISDSGRSKMIMANLKNQITEPIITIRNMRMGAYAVTNRAGWIFASNMPDAVVVATNDRRFNVGEYQPKPIELTLDDFTALENELLDFAVFLRLYEVDEKAVREPLKNEAKEQLILVSRNSADVVAQALLDGQMHQLWDALPSGNVDYSNPREADAYHHFKNLMHSLVLEKREKITREELYAIFNFCVGNVSSSPWKLTSYLKHHGIELKRIRMNEAITMGMYVIWKDSQEWFDERRAEIAKATQPTLKAVK
jgi:hypothetical protein